MVTDGQVRRLLGELRADRPLWWAAIWDAYDAGAPVDDDKAWMDFAERVGRRYLDAMVEGLRRFDASFAWRPRIDRDCFHLLIFDPDPDVVEEVRELASRLNPPESFAEFGADFDLEEDD